jgi:hypothetical protein
MEKSIEDWCHELGLEKYSIDVNGRVDVDSFVYIGNAKLKSIPIKFGMVADYFYCNYNKLKTLEGSPIIVLSNFNCGYNKLKTLEGSPVFVCGDFYCNNNQLISLKGGPNKFSGGMDCVGNPVYDEFIKYNNYTQYMRSVKLKEFLCQ